MTIQFGIIFGTYLLSYFIMEGLSLLIPAVRTIIFGFNFLIGTLLAVLVKFIINKLKKKNIIKKQYMSNYFMNRIGGFAFDIMIVTGIGAIQIELIKEYWIVLLVMGIAGAIATILYVHYTSKKFFPKYQYEQFLAMYGMLTGTASTGIILLREIDSDFSTPASDNLVFQTLPAIVFGFPMMLLATYCPQSDTATYITLSLMFVFLIIMTSILFRNSIFIKKKKEV